jgi:hypothetical protein
MRSLWARLALLRVLLRVLLLALREPLLRHRLLVLLRYVLFHLP